MGKIEFFETKPHDFNSQLEGSACYVEINGKFLLLERSHNNVEGKKWGVPAGKKEGDETPEECARRELFEETGIKTESAFLSFGTIYIRKPDLEYAFHLFKVELLNFPEVSLSHEHLSYKWVPFDEIKNFNLMDGALECLRIYQQRNGKKKRSVASVNVQLVLRRGGQVLLYLRKKTGYNDGLYGLVAGHVDEGESAVKAIIREAHEEAGIRVLESDLTLVHVTHWRSNRNNVDLFFLCDKWEGEIFNKEPDKCGELRFCEIDHLPSNMIPYIEKGLKGIEARELYTEGGWL